MTANSTIPRRESNARALTAAVWAFVVAEAAALIARQLALVLVFMVFALACAVAAARERSDYYGSRDFPRAGHPATPAASTADHTTP